MLVRSCPFTRRDPSRTFTLSPLILPFSSQHLARVKGISSNSSSVPVSRGSGISNSTLPKASIMIRVILLSLLILASLPFVYFASLAIN